MRVGSQTIFLLALIVGGVLLSGCHPPTAQEMAERQALQRHAEESRQRAAFFRLIQAGGETRVRAGVEWLRHLHAAGKLPGGLAADAHGSGELEKMPDVEPDGPYFFTEQFSFRTAEEVPRIFHFTVVQTHSHSDFQLLAAWRTDSSGKIVETFPIHPTPARSYSWHVWFQFLLKSGAILAGCAVIGILVWYWTRRRFNNS